MISFVFLCVWDPMLLFQNLSWRILLEMKTKLVKPKNIPNSQEFTVILIYDTQFAISSNFLNIISEMFVVISYILNFYNFQFSYNCKWFLLRFCVHETPWMPINICGNSYRFEIFHWVFGSNVVSIVKWIFNDLNIYGCKPPLSI